MPSLLTPPKLQELKTELATAITDATRYRDAIKAIKDATENDSLAELVEKVTGADDTMTPGKIAEAIAVEVEKEMAFYTETESNTNQCTWPPITGGITPSTVTAKAFGTHYLMNYGG